MGPIRVDSCWSWAVALGATSVNILTGSIGHTYGLLFVALLDDLEKVESLASLPGSLFLAVYFLTGLVITPLARVCGWRLVIALGSVLSASGFFLSSFCQDIYLFCLLYGIITGIGVGLLYCGVIVRLQNYFRKYRALANGLFASGAGVGTMILGPVVSASIEGLGWRNTLRIEAALFSIVSLTSPLFGPVVGEANDQGSSGYGTMDETRQPPFSQSDKQGSSSYELMDEAKKPIIRQSDIQGSSCYGSMDETREPPSGQSDTSDVQASEQSPDLELTEMDRCMTFRQTCTEICGRCKCDFSLFCNCNFLLVAFTCSAYIFGENVVYTYLADWAESNGVPDEQVGDLSIIIGGASLGSRLVFGFVMDRSMKVRCVSLGLSILLLGLASFTIPLLDSFLLLGIYSACFGVFAGIFWSTYAVVIVDLLGEEIKDYAIGQALACVGVLALCSGPSAGLVMRWTGRLFTTIQFAGGAHLLAAMALFIAVSIYFHRENHEMPEEKEMRMGK